MALRSFVSVSLLTFCGLWLVVAAPTPDPKQASPNLADYRTVANAVTAKIVPGSGRPGQTGYLGVAVKRDDKGQLVVEEVQIDSPAARAGIKRGDQVLRVGDQAVRTADAFREWLQAHGPGEVVKLSLKRDGKEMQVSASLTALSRPMTVRDQRAFLGISLGDPVEGKGIRVEQVTRRSGAAEAGLKEGDILAKFDGKELRRPSRLTELLDGKKAGDKVTLTVIRDNKEVELKATLTEAARGGGRGGFGGFRGIEIWKKDSLRLAVVAVEFADEKHNAKMPIKEWEEALFSQGTYKDKKDFHGQDVHGSLRDYVQEVSGGKLRLEGKVFNWVEVKKKRGEYQEGSGTSNKTALLEEALGKLTERDGKDALKDVDGMMFLYAGDRVRTNAGALYYPHAGTVTYQGKRYPYLIGPEGKSKLAIGGFVKELGRALGLPDLSSRPENVGSEGLGQWCAMSEPQTTSRPQHFSAFAKEKLGWIKPTVIDPTIKQKLILAPIEDNPSECFKVLVRPDGSEYFLLENRKKKGFDSDLPGEGLLIWRVVNEHPILEEAHGVEGATGPLVHLSAVPYPSQANNSFTPETTPSSRSPRGGGLPVRITDIRRLPDGRITFHVGYQYR